MDTMSLASRLDWGGFRTAWQEASPVHLTVFRRRPTTTRTMGNVVRPVTALLKEISNGNRDAVGELMPLVYEELRALAGRIMASERTDHTLQPTALVHEAFLRLVPEGSIDWQGRAHFAATSARAMRRILVNHARDRGADKRGGKWRRVTLDPDLRFESRPEVELLALDEALVRLTKMNELSGSVLEMRFFGGLTIAETAHILNVSTTTVENHWAMARAWLSRELAESR